MIDVAASTKGFFKQFLYFFCSAGQWRVFYTGWFWVADFSSWRYVLPSIAGTSSVAWPQCWWSSRTSILVMKSLWWMLRMVRKAVLVELLRVVGNDNKWPINLSHIKKLARNIDLYTLIFVCSFRCLLHHTCLYSLPKVLLAFTSLLSTYWASSLMR